MRATRKAASRRVDVRSIDFAAEIRRRDPETLLGPLLWLLTRLARDETAVPEAGDVRQALVEHCTALAAHPAVSPMLRIALGGIAIEHRDRAHVA